MGRDKMRFYPITSTVAEGETLKLVIHNDGQLACMSRCWETQES